MVLVISRKNEKLWIIFFLIALSWSILASIHANDFDVYINAANRLKNGDDIYSPPFYHESLKYFYSPLLALLLVPFTYFPSSIVETCWLLFLFYSICEIWVLAESYFEISKLSKKQYRNWILISLFFIFSTVLYNISQVQVTVFLV